MAVILYLEIVSFFHVFGVQARAPTGKVRLSGLTRSWKVEEKVRDLGMPILLTLQCKIYAVAHRIRSLLKTVTHRNIWRRSRVELAPILPLTGVGEGTALVSLRLTRNRRTPGKACVFNILCLALGVPSPRKDGTSSVPYGRVDFQPNCSAKQYTTDLCP